MLYFSVLNKLLEDYIDSIVFIVTKRIQLWTNETAWLHLYTALNTGLIDWQYTELINWLGLNFISMIFLRGHNLFKAIEIGMSWGIPQTHTGIYIVTRLFIPFMLKPISKFCTIIFTLHIIHPFSEPGSVYILYSDTAFPSFVTM